MKKIYLLIFAACLSASAMAQEKFELGKPNDDNYRYLDEYLALKEYIDYTKYPNFKLGAGTTVSDYLNKSLVKNLINKNFSAFATINNIGCQYYARYYDFNSFGINALVGITYSFGKESVKNKKK